ncbi:PTS sugar transporter subunit IIA [Subtercola boreus]|uniref:PTS fructose transporter subunit IIA n=1 Tax=Subtercola boreus TaxID=120213 RepID=A0A3E0W888_9MICO|nr:PTS sugar transporter subunit IIA [Subtercola boreus]RFA18250.1 PTS fructose transporter subunit IIA [Subtercola boreus]RFA18642.1 PTS fructose transporter subunit IIA [Subtercola boreus]RFA25246.1 PTS fructose transporter subunit IIA [Subtercola boreus]
MASTTPLTEAGLVIVDLAAPTKDEATRQLAQTLFDQGRVSDLDGFLADVRAREAQMATGLPGGIGIPHARSSHVTVASVAVGVSPAGVDFGAEDGPAHLIFLIAAPDGADQNHLVILAQLARKLVHDDFRQSLRDAGTPEAVAEIVTREVVLP